jgi:hypothetical protein
MAVMAREEWTDQRLDDLNERIVGIERRMEAGFAEMRTEFKSLRADVRTEFKSVRGEVRSEFKSVRAELKAEFKSVREEMGAGFKGAAAESVSIRRDMANQFAAQNRMILQLAGGMFATMVVGFLGTIATVITQT